MYVATKFLPNSAKFQKSGHGVASPDEKQDYPSASAYTLRYCYTSLRKHRICAKYAIMS